MRTAATLAQYVFYAREYEVERVVLNALAMSHAALPPIICAFGDSLRIVFGEADPPATTQLASQPRLDITLRVARQRTLG